MDSDRILVMENGFAREFDIPYKLLQKPTGLLKEMVEATGDSEELKKIAADNYERIFNQDNQTNKSLWKFKDT